MRDSFLEAHRQPAVRGWLLLLCALLMVWQPIALGYALSQVLDALPIRGTPLALLLAARVVAAGLGIAAGIAIVSRATSGIAMAKAALTLSAALELFLYVTPYYPNNRVPGDTPLYVAGSLAYYVVWMIYLSISRRVKDFLSPPGSQPPASSF